jgi:hypothetical protein
MYYDIHFSRAAVPPLSTESIASYLTFACFSRMYVGFVPCTLYI